MTSRKADAKTEFLFNRYRYRYYLSLQCAKQSPLIKWKGSRLFLTSTSGDLLADKWTGITFEFVRSREWRHEIDAAVRFLSRTNSYMYLQFWYQSKWLRTLGAMVGFLPVWTLKCACKFEECEFLTCVSYNVFPQSKWLCKRLRTVGTAVGFTWFEFWNFPAIHLLFICLRNVNLTSVNSNVFPQST